MSRKEQYLAKYRDPKWQQMRLRVMERDDWACRGCGKTDKTINAHHSYYEFGRDPWDYPEASLITLCDECHEAEHASWDCDGIKQALCCNGLWCVDVRSLLASAINGRPDQRPLNGAEACAMIRIVGAYAWSVRDQSGGDSIAEQMYRLAKQAPPVGK